MPDSTAEPVPFSGEFARLYGEYLTSGALVSWEAWLAARPAEVTSGEDAARDARPVTGLLVPVPAPDVWLAACAIRREADSGA